MCVYAQKQACKYVPIRGLSYYIYSFRYCKCNDCKITHFSIVRSAGSYLSNAKSIKSLLSLGWKPNLCHAMANSKLSENNWNVSLPNCSIEKQSNSEQAFMSNGHLMTQLKFDHKPFNDITLVVSLCYHNAIRSFYIQLIHAFTFLIELTDRSLYRGRCIFIIAKNYNFFSILFFSSVDVDDVIIFFVFISLQVCFITFLAMLLI